MLRLTDGGMDWWMRSGMDYPCVLIFFVIAIFIFGSCLGSFLNVCIWRMPLGESIANAPSHCTKCGYEIRWYDNIPIFSYLYLRGRCRNCKAPYSARYLIVEALTGLLFVLIYVKVGLVQQPLATLAVYWPLALLCVTTAWIDAEHRIIPDGTTYPAMVIGLAASVLFPSIWGMESRLAAGAAALASGAIPALFLALFALLGQRLSGREVIGWGDVKFIACAGILLGVPGALFTLLAGSLAGTVYGVVVAKVRKRSVKRVFIAFGPFLAGAALLWIFAGEPLLRRYLQFASSGALAQ